jgi:hypothetical protein
VTVLDVPMIQTRGFRNRDGGEGFELRLRLPYYRGVWTNLVEGASVTVDGEHYPADRVGWTIAGRDYTLAELRSSEEARWPVDVAAVLRVPRDEPLSIGLHDVSAELRLQMSYIPEELQPTIWTDNRRMVITR